MRTRVHGPLLAAAALLLVIPLPAAGPGSLTVDSSRVTDVSPGADLNGAMRAVPAAESSAVSPSTLSERSWSKVSGRGRLLPPVGDIARGSSAGANVLAVVAFAGIVAFRRSRLAGKPPDPRAPPLRLQHG